MLWSTDPGEADVGGRSPGAKVSGQHVVKGSRLQRTTSHAAHNADPEAHTSAANNGAHAMQTSTHRLYHALCVLEVVVRVNASARNALLSAGWPESTQRPSNTRHPRLWLPGSHVGEPTPQPKGGNTSDVDGHGTDPTQGSLRALLALVLQKAASSGPQTAPGPSTAATIRTCLTKSDAADAAGGDVPSTNVKVRSLVGQCVSCASALPFARTCWLVSFSAIGASNLRHLL